MPLYQHQAEIIAARRKQSAAQAAQAAAAKRAAEQQKYYQQRAQQETSARQAQQKAQQAMQRRAAEQQAYYQEQQARAAEQRRLQASQARSDSVRKKRVARATTHTVKQGDTPESIGKAYGMEARKVAGLVPRLRPGQRLTVEDQRAASREQTFEAPGGGGPILPAAGIMTMPFGQKLAEGVVGILPTIARVMGRIGLAGAQAGPPPLIGAPEGSGAGEQFTAFGESMMSQADELERSREFALATGQDVPQADLSQYNELRRPPGGIHAQMEATMEKAQQTQSLWAVSMRYTGQALGYAWEAMSSGDPDWQRFISDSDGNVNMLISNNLWDTGPMREQFSETMWDKVEELGFVPIAEGLWGIPEILPPDYGMGDYSFPGYGGGFGGGGGGDYEYLSRGGQMRRKRGGGISVGERYRIFPEGVSPAHWRI